MQEKDTFSRYHPAVNFVYFGFVLIFSMLFMHPLTLLLSLGCGLCYAVSLKGREMAKSAVFLVPAAILTAVINPLFTHRGVTVLLYLPTGNPLTGESIVYGIAASFMLSSVIIWFICFSQVITADKITFLFGRILPAVSLVIVMVLSFIPRFKEKFKTVRETQRFFGPDAAEGRLKDKIKNGGAVLSIMTGWALESAVETADSMKSRGYGERRRSFYNVYSFSRRDGWMLSFIILCGIYVFYGYFSGIISWQYYPAIKIGGLSPDGAGVYAAFAALCLGPVIVNLAEGRKWQKSRSKI